MRRLKKSGDLQLQSAMREIEEIQARLQSAQNPDGLYQAALSLVPGGAKVIRARGAGSDWRLLDAIITAEQNGRAKEEAKIDRGLQNLTLMMPDLDTRALVKDRSEQAMEDLLRKTNLFQLATVTHGEDMMSSMMREARSQERSAKDLFPAYRPDQLHDTRSQLDSVCGDILHSWQELKKQLELTKSDGVFDRIRTHWACSTRSDKTVWLKQHFADLPDRPFEVVYRWIDPATKSTSTSVERVCLTSTLNTTDLSSKMLLCDFLEARTEHHPRLFLRRDARSVAFGLRAGLLKNKKRVGRVSFAVETSVEDDTEYGYRLEQSLSDDQSEIDADLAQYMLEAQLCTYQFLLQCLSFLSAYGMPEPGLQHSTEHNGPDGSVSILEESAHSDLLQPFALDIDSLRDAVEAHCNEALTDLFDMREVPAIWLKRIRETRSPQLNRNLHPLRTVFSRIDPFGALSECLNTVQQDSSVSAQLQTPRALDEPVSRNPLQDNVTVFVALRCMMIDLLSAVKALSWRPKGKPNNPLNRAFKMINTSDPLMHTLGPDAVLRIIEYELAPQGLDDVVPAALVRALSDASVVSVWANEYNKTQPSKTSLPSDSIPLVLKAETYWRTRERPWRRIADWGLDELNRTGHKVNIRVQSDLDVAREYLKFWNAFDKHLPKDGKLQATVNVILQHKLADLDGFVAENRQDLQRPIPLDTPQVSDTRLRRSKRKPGLKHPPICSSGLISTPQALTCRVEDASRPVIRIRERDRDIWMLINGTEKGTVTFKQFRDVMARAGYCVRNCFGGCMHRFELPSEDGRRPHSVVFHGVHGNDVKVQSFDAQKLWAKRITSVVTVIVD